MIDSNSVRTFQHSFQVRAPLAEVIDFHNQRDSLKAITPPPILMQIHQGPEVLGQGDEVDFTMWLGPIPIHWVARIENVADLSFQDRQVQGPFHRWVHTHSFVALDAETTEVRDQVEAVWGQGLYTKFLSANMWLGLPLLFAFRGWKTRQLLASRPRHGSTQQAASPSDQAEK